MAAGLGILAGYALEAGSWLASNAGTIASLAATGAQVYQSTQTPDVKAPKVSDMDLPKSGGIQNIQQTQGRQIELAKGRKGRSSTIASTPLGVSGNATIKKKSLLGV